MFDLPQKGNEGFREGLILGIGRAYPAHLPQELAGAMIVGQGGEKLWDGGTVSIIVTSASCGSGGPIPRCPTCHNLMQFVAVAALILYWR